MVVVVLSLAGQADAVDRETRREPAHDISAGLRDLYDSLSDLSLEDQRQQMWGMTSRTRTALWTHNIQRYLRDHPELSIEEQEVLREGLRLVVTPGWFDMAPGSPGYEMHSSTLEAFKQRMAAELPREVIVEVFIRLGAEPDSVPLEAPTDGGSRRLLPRTEVYLTCSCSGWWECGMWSERECAPSWCDPSRHCGVFGNEVCWGNCKLTGL
jgi:hypothetical protein